MGQKENSIRPTTDLKYENILTLFEDIANGRYARNADFILPQNLRFSDLGRNAAFCQAIITWFNLNPKSKVRIYDNNFSSNQSELDLSINKICENASLPTLLAITFGIRTGIWGHTYKNIEYTSKFLPALEKRLKYDYLELTRVASSKELHNEYFQIHPDFLSDTLFLKNPSFYLRIGSEYYMKTEVAINEATTKLFNRIDSLGTEMTKNWLREIQTYFYEIFENAYKWARTDWTDRIAEPELENTVRLFFISSKRCGLSNQTNEVTLDKKLDDFMKKHASKDEWGSNVKLMELSILDNGLGIVQTFKRESISKRSMSIVEEYKLLLEAFELGSTSDKTYRGAIRGIGLSKVVSRTKNAFVIIRTGRLFLYRNFSVHPYSPNENLFFFDASDYGINQSEAEQNIREYAPARGTLFSFIIPL